MIKKNEDNDIEDGDNALLATQHERNSGKLQVYNPTDEPEDEEIKDQGNILKDVNVEYAGGGMKIGATRKTSISWTCWSWEELQKFKPFFLNSEPKSSTLILYFLAIS